MPRISDFALLKQPVLHTLAVRRTTRVENMPSLIGESYGRIAAYLQELGEIMSDIPFVAYHNMDMENLDVEIGFHVASAIPGKDDIVADTIPAGKVVFSMYRGPYHEIEPVYMDMARWIEDNGLKAASTCYEYYYNGPEFPESELLTKVVMPVE